MICTAEPLLRVEHVSRSFGQLQVLHDVSLAVLPAEVVAIVGPSGAGKTTLLQIMGSLDRPDSGRILYGDTDIFRLPDKRLAAFRNTHIGFVFQFHGLLPELSLVENVELPALIGGRSRSQTRRKAMELVDYMGLRDRADHKPAQLSGGEKQRAAVARALINDPKVVLADEPSGSLDSHNRAELHRLFFQLRADRGQTFVIVTHDEGLADSADRLIRMKDGSLDF